MNYNTVFKEGKLRKEGGSIKTWRDRWCVLQDGLLSYHKGNNKNAPRQGQIDLTVCGAIQPVNYKGKKHCFEVETESRNYHMCAANAQDMKEWIEALTKAKEEIKANGSFSSSKDNKTSASVGQEQKPAGGQHGETVKVNDFEPLKVIGRGSFGKVLQVRYKRNNKIYAMKVLNKRTILERNEVAHTQAEKSILMKLDNPFLVHLYYSFQTTDKLYFIMDFVNGGELFFHLQKDKTFSPERVLFYSAEILLGLEYLHEQGVIYRDLKPENILLTSGGHICMTDFGISKEGLHCKDDRTATFCGTPEYLAPEVLEGKGYGKAVDWWSFGTLIFEMMTGLPPFYSEEVQLMYKKIMTQPLHIPDKISPDAANLLQALLERDPAKRLSDPAVIKAHPYFVGVDWDKMVKRQVTPPFIPPVKDESYDVGQISQDFLKEPVVLSVTDTSDLGEAGHFQEFTWQAKGPING